MDFSMDYYHIDMSLYVLVSFFVCTCEMIKNISHTTNHCYWFIACTHCLWKKCFIMYLKGKINTSANMNTTKHVLLQIIKKINALDNLRLGQKFLNLFIIPHVSNVSIESLAHFFYLLIYLFLCFEVFVNMS